MNLFYWCTLYVVKAFFFLFYRHRVFGLQNVPKGAAILAPNHVSYYDPPIVAISIPEEISFLARDTLFDSWILGPIMRWLNTYPVSGSASDLGSFKTICKLLNEGKKVVIFPEGERSWEGRLNPLQQGVAMLAFRCNCPIIPVYIKGAYEAFPRGKVPKLWGRTSCAFGEPLYPATYADLDKKSAQSAMTQDLEKALQDLQLRNISRA